MAGSEIEDTGMNTRSTLDLPGSFAMGHGMETLIVAQAAHIDALQAADPDFAASHIGTCALQPSEPLPEDRLAGVRVIVLEVDPREPASLARLERVRTVAPTLPVIVALAQTDTRVVRALLRRGVNDVVDLPMDPAELFDRIVDCAANSAVAEPLQLAPQITVMRASGGAGATTLLTHLGAALAAAEGGPRSVCLIDLDMQSGEVANYLGVQPISTVGDLLEAGDRLDADMLRDAAVGRGDDLHVIAAPTDIEPIENVPADRLAALIDLARTQFDCVLVDLPASWANWTLSAIAHSDRILLVTDEKLKSIRQARRRIALFDEVGIDRQCVDIVLTRTGRSLFRSVGKGDVEDTLGCSVDGTIALGEKDMAEAQDQGLLLTELRSRSAYEKSVDALAGHLVQSLWETA